MKLYACAAIAVKQELVSMRTSLMAMTVLANNDSEARGKAHELAREYAPVKDGWGQYDVTILEVSDAALAAVNGNEPSEDHGE
jgi:hypothetical protein